MSKGVSEREREKRQRGRKEDLSTVITHPNVLLLIASLELEPSEVLSDIDLLRPKLHEVIPAGTHKDVRNLEPHTTIMSHTDVKNPEPHTTTMSHTDVENPEPHITIT